MGHPHVPYSFSVFVRLRTYSSVFAWAKQRRRARAKNQCASVEAFAMHHHACAQRPCCKPCHWLDRGLPPRCSLALLLPVKQAALQLKGLHADRIVPVRACWPCQQACARKQAFCRLPNCSTLAQKSLLMPPCATACLSQGALLRQHAAARPCLANKNGACSRMPRRMVACLTLRRKPQRGMPHIWAIITSPKPEQLTCVAPSIRRAKS